MIAPFIRNVWYVAAWSHELSDRPIGRTVAGEPIMLYRRSDGTTVAMEDRCPHRQAPLSLGRIEGDTIRCMYHGMVFDSSGTCLSIPGAAAIPANTDVRTFPVVERHDWLWVWTGDPSRADPALIPEAYGLNNPDWVMRADALDYDADYQLINDNLCDLSHVDYTHETTLGFASGSKWSNDAPRITPIENGLLFERWFVDQIAQPGRPELTDTFTMYHYMLPGLFIMRSRMYPTGTASSCGLTAPPSELPMISQRIEQQAITPIAQGRTRYLYATGVEARIASPELLETMMAVINAAFAEDKAMIEAQQRIWNVTDADKPKAFIPQDKGPSLFRRMIAKRLREEADA